MEKKEQDTLVRAYAMLMALQKNVAELPSVTEIYLTEYHLALDMLEGIGIDVTQFRIPSSEVQRHVASFNLSDGSKNYSKDKYIPKALLLTKLEAILTYFELTTSKEARKIGFTPPDKQ